MARSLPHPSSAPGNRRCRRACGRKSGIAPRLVAGSTSAIPTRLESCGWPSCYSGIVPLYFGPTKCCPQHIRRRIYHKKSREHSAMTVGQTHRLHRCYHTRARTRPGRSLDVVRQLLVFVKVVNWPCSGFSRNWRAPIVTLVSLLMQCSITAIRQRKTERSIRYRADQPESACAGQETCKEQRHATIRGTERCPSGCLCCSLLRW